jgi:hypothetical protein
MEHCYNRSPKENIIKMQGGLKDLGIGPELYVKETETGTNLPVATTTLSKAERNELCEFFHDLKVPSG